MSKMLTEFNRQYDRLYKAAEWAQPIIGYQEAVTWFDNNQDSATVAPVVTAMVRERGDFISSDREAAAFAFAYEVLA